MKSWKGRALRAEDDIRERKKTHSDAMSAVSDMASLLKREKIEEKKEKIEERKEKIEDLHKYIRV